MDAEQPVRFVVTVILPRILVDLRQQAANDITLKFGTALRPLCPVAVADFILARQMPAQVVGEPTRQVVDSFLFDQAIRSVISKFISRIVFVDQRGEPNRLVVLVTNALAFGVLPRAWQAALVALQPDDLALAVGMSKHLPEGVVRKRFLCAIRMFDAQHFTRGFKL